MKAQMARVLICFILQGFEWAFRKSYPTKIRGIVQWGGWGGGGSIVTSKSITWQNECLIFVDFFGESLTN